MLPYQSKKGGENVSHYKNSGSKYKDFVRGWFNADKIVSPMGGVRTFRQAEKIIVWSNQYQGGQAQKIMEDTYAIPLSEVDIPVTVWSFTTGTNANPSFNQLLVETGGNKTALESSFEVNYNTLKDLLTQTPSYSAMAKFVFPISKFISLGTLYSMILVRQRTMREGYLGATKGIIGTIFKSYQEGETKNFADISSIQDMEGGTNPLAESELDPFWELILKMIIETPFLIIKGVTEASDPNVLLAKKIFDVLDTTVKSGKGLMLKQINKLFDDQLTKKAAELGVPKTSDQLMKWDEWLKSQGHDPESLDPDKGVPPQVQLAISLLLFPSMLPYGVGFPPPPIGPGIGPPMTPLAPIYYAMQLNDPKWLEGTTKTDLTNEIPGCEGPFSKVVSSSMEMEEEFDDEEDPEIEEVFTIL